jgi:uncharacterized RDD family membrane protein YckC
MNYDSSFQVNTPENVALEYPLAGIGSRFLASLADHLLIAGIILVVNLVAVFAFFIAFQKKFQSSSGESNWLYWILAILGIITFAIQYGYFIFFEILWNGQTPGKRAVRLRVVRTNGLPLSAGEALIRNIVRIVDSLPMAYGVGLVVMFIDSQSRRLGDLAAGTLVIREQASVSLSSLVPARGIQADGADLPEISLERLSAAERSLIADFLRRRDTLVNRKELAGVLLEKLYRRLERIPRDEERRNPEEALEKLARGLADKEHL